MVYCTKCGTQFEGRYCPNCGAPAEAAPPAGAPGYTAPGVPPPAMAPAIPGIPSNWASVICYVVFVAGPVVFLLLAPYNRDRKIRFDAWQGLFMQIAYVMLNLVFSQFVALSWRLEHLLLTLLNLAYLGLVIVMAVKAYQNERLVLPVVGPLAEKQR